MWMGMCASGMPLKVKGNEYLAMDLPRHWIYIDNFKLKKSSNNL
jgi:hypothetical protein